MSENATSNNISSALNGDDFTGMIHFGMTTSIRKKTIYKFNPIPPPTHLRFQRQDLRWHIPAEQIVTEIKGVD
jgi:hypothetical protein